MEGIDNDSYGIVFGREKGSYYFFGIAASDSFIYYKYIDLSNTPYIKWKDTPKFNKWSSNHIEIKKIDSQLSFFVNGVLVDTFKAEPFFGKQFGFRVTSNQKVSFRNFKLSNLVEDDTYGSGINVTDKNSSCIKNLSTLFLALATNNGSLQMDYFNKGIALAKVFFTNESIEKYSKLIAGERYIYNSEKTIHFYINDIVASLKRYLDDQSGITTGELINSFSSFPIEAKQFLNNRFVAKQIQNIERELEHSEVERKNLPEKAIQTGKQLIINTKTDFEYLKSVLGINDFQYQIISDKLSLEIIQCGIDSFNSFKNAKGDIDYVKAIISEEAYLSEYEYAYSIAVTDRVVEKARENLKTCKEWIKQKPTREKNEKAGPATEKIMSQINSIIKLLKNQDFYTLSSLQNKAMELVENTKNDLNSIKIIYATMPLNYIRISSEIVSAALACMVAYINATSAKNGIQASSVNFVRSLDSFAMDSKTRLYYDKNIITLQNMYNTSKSRSSGSSNCYIATMVYGSSEARNVLILRKFRDEYLMPYGLGRFFIKTYYRYSPGFVVIFKNNKLVNNTIRHFLDKLTKILPK